jgi:hypothetical protein
MTMLLTQCPSTARGFNTAVAADVLIAFPALPQHFDLIKAAPAGWTSSNPALRVNLYLISIHKHGSSFKKQNRTLLIDDSSRFRMNLSHV